ncbi:MAG: DUF4126 domain-containing protein [Anaerolineae bacterium]|nr:DUF4126 domain-containing protein [Anaerolineae bacterium]
MQWILDLASAFGLSTSSGLNAYIPMLTLALLARFTNFIKLEEPWSNITNWWIIGLLGVLLVIEELADKIPAVDTINDVIQTFIRPTAGAIVFAATTQSSIHIHPVFALGCGLVLAGSVHVIKAGSRPVLTATTAGVANPIVSTIEDIISVVTSFIAIIFPYLILGWLILLAILLLLVIRWKRQRMAEK